MIFPVLCLLFMSSLGSLSFKCRTRHRNRWRSKERRVEAWRGRSGRRAASCWALYGGRVGRRATSESDMAHRHCMWRKSTEAWKPICAGGGRQWVRVYDFLSSTFFCLFIYLFHFDHKWWQAMCFEVHEKTFISLWPPCLRVGTQCRCCHPTCVGGLVWETA